MESQPNPPTTRLLLSSIWILCVLAAAALGAAASVSAADFYLQLQRPPWAPPAWLFGPVWSVLYLMMAVSIVRHLRATHASRGNVGLSLFGAQLAANALWSWLFFAWRMGAASFLCISVLIVLLLFTIRTFRRIDAVSAWLLMPYLVWVCFASLLNVTVWQLNPQLLG